MKPLNLATSPNPQNNRVGLRRKMKAPIYVQPQVQPREISQIKEETLSTQNKGIQTPLTKPTIDQH